MPTPTQRAQHEQWLMEITAIPTAAGREQRVIAWVESWVKARRNLALRFDKAGNVFITRRSARKTGKKRPRPLYITAHMDHPAFVVHSLPGDDIVDLQFRGGVHDPYFENAAIDIFDQHDQPHRATITKLDSAAKPFKRVKAWLNSPTNTLRVGDVARWALESHQPLPRVEGKLFQTYACDDLAALAAAISALDMLGSRRGFEHIGLLLTRAEEVGFIGAIAACTHKSIPKSARLICLENSRSFAESPIGGGPIVRVGDKLSVFHPDLTNRIGAIMMEHQKNHPEFTFQRKLMPGGSCEATTFSSFGYQSTCLCLPLGNYHNMIDIDQVLAGQREGRIGPEFIAIDDYHGLIDMLVICAEQLDSAKVPTIDSRMRTLFRDFGFVLRP